MNITVMTNSFFCDREGSVIVSHEIFVEIEYKPELNITQQYNRVFEMVIHLLELSSNCTSAASKCYTGVTIHLFISRWQCYAHFFVFCFFFRPLLHDTPV